MIVSSDKVPPYERPALSKGFLAPHMPARLPGFYTTKGAGGEAHDAMWYVQHGIEWRGNTTIIVFDPEHRKLTTDRGAIIEYDKLLLATGCAPIGLKNLDDIRHKLYYMRDLSSAEIIANHIYTLREAPRGHMLIIGTGYLGMEIASGAVTNCVKVGWLFIYI